MSDFMELGDSGIIVLENGWLLDTKTNMMRSPAGVVYHDGKIVYDPEEQGGPTT